jgi:hypothetical protein
MGRLVYTGLGSSSLTAHVLHSPPPSPHALSPRVQPGRPRPDPLGGFQIPRVRWAGGWFLHQPPWSFGFDSQTRGTRENRPHSVLVPGSSGVPWVWVWDWVHTWRAWDRVHTSESLHTSESPRHAPSRAPLLLATLLSHTIPFPRVH